MAINVGDVVFDRIGRPVIVTSKDGKTGAVKVEDDLSKVQEATENGVKNGLHGASKASFSNVLDEIRDPDKRREIDALTAKIAKLKQEVSDPRMLRYLESELQYRISKERYRPKDMEVDPFALT